METEKTPLDPRAQRTRNLLHEAFGQLMREMGFPNFTVLDIAKRAHVNRGTFYLHYSDKYAILDEYIHEEFQRFLPAQLAIAAPLSRENIHLLILTIMDYFAQTSRHARCVDKPIEPILEVTIQKEIYQMVTRWLKQSQEAGIRLPASLETVATAISWAIFGIGIQWKQSPGELKLETVAHQATTLLVNGLSPMIPSLSLS